MEAGTIAGIFYLVGFAMGAGVLYLGITIGEKMK